MDKQVYLATLLGMQLLLLGLDLLERIHLRVPKPGAQALRLRSVLFLGCVIAIYGAIQFAGLALVPNFEDVVVRSQAAVAEYVSPARRVSVINPLAIALFSMGGFYFAGLCDYLFHRFINHSKVAWITHEYHHLPTDVSVYMPGFCVRPFLVVTLFPSSVIAIFSIQFALALAGYVHWSMMPLVYTVALLQIGIGGMSHSAFLRRCGWIHRWLKPLGILSPQEHWLHHASDLEGNYGNFVTVWDRVFGTYIDPELTVQASHRAGLPYDQDFLGALTRGRLKLPQVVRSTFQLNQFCYLEPVSAEGDSINGSPATN
jgi:sterol desaturase/sphingolipid hydroxylase (fatty acid hydroxylase superfamily)